MPQFWDKFESNFNFIADEVIKVNPKNIIKSILTEF
jgi:hypothetical protein